MLARDRVARRGPRALKFRPPCRSRRSWTCTTTSSSTSGSNPRSRPSRPRRSSSARPAYARDALRALEACTDPKLDQRALRDLSQRATVIETHLRTLHQLALERCDDAAIREIPVAVGANLELAAKCRSIICERTAAVDQEVMILRAPLPQFQLPC